MQKLYAIKDKSMGFSETIISSNDYGAIRLCADRVNSKQENFFNMHAEDLDLYCLGEFDTDTGAIKNEIKYVMSFLDMKK